MKKTALITVAILLSMSLILNLYFITQKNFDITGFSALDTTNYAEAKISITEDSIFLTSNCKTLAMIISKEQTQNIILGAINQTTPRPLTHDTIKNILDVFDIEILQVQINDMREETYLAKIFLKKENKIVSIDVRPSDALAIAVRYQLPVLVNKDLLEKHGQDSC